MAAKLTKIMTRIMDTVEASDNGADWTAIYEHCKKFLKPGENAMTVRNHLQGLINAGYIKRTDDTKNEVYVEVSK